MTTIERERDRQRAQWNRDALRMRAIALHDGEIRPLNIDGVMSVRRPLVGTKEHVGRYNPAYLEKYVSDEAWANLCPFAEVGEELRLVEDWSAWLPGMGSMRGQLVDDGMWNNVYRADVESETEAGVFFVDTGGCQPLFEGRMTWRPGTECPPWRQRTVKVTGIRIRCFDGVWFWIIDVEADWR